MKRAAIYKPLGPSDHELCYPVNKKYFLELTDLIDGSSRAAHWTPIEMELVRENMGRKLQPADAPWGGTSCELIFKPTVVQALGSLLQQYGELLPLKCKDAHVVMYNPTRVIEALDEEKSDITRFDDGRIMMIDKHVFHADKIVGVDVFKLPMRASATYVSQRFADLWASHGLTGLEFVPVK